MNKRDFNIDFSENDQGQIFPEIELHYQVSKEEVWNKLMDQIQSPESQIKSVVPVRFFRLSVAASLVLLMSLTFFLRFYTKTVDAPAGQHLSFYLPDSSYIELNAQTKVTYHPYWYKIARTVSLEGEAFFKVASGNRFSVESQKGETTVLGTSFNIYSRNNNYNVTCFTGKVRVVSKENKQAVLLSPDEQAILNDDGILQFVQGINSLLVKSWRDNMFIFTGSSVLSVIQEIERQYNVKVVFRGDAKLTYTGNFSKTLTQKEVLDLVCTSLGLTFEAKSGNEFLVN
ncbi:MAG: FecR domain-containing protein [Mariniphaga sp.]